MAGVSGGGDRHHPARHTGMPGPREVGGGGQTGRTNGGDWGGTKTGRAVGEVELLVLPSATVTSASHLTLMGVDGV